MQRQGAVRIDAGSVGPSPRAIIARRLLLTAVPLGILADPLLRNQPWGLGLLIWMAVFAVVVLTVLRLGGRSLPPEGRVWLAVAVLSGAGLSWRDAEMLQSFDVMAMLTALVLLGMNLNTIPVPGLAVARIRDLARAAFAMGLDVFTGIFPLLLRDAEHNVARRPATGGNVWRISKALLITLPILIVFTVLLTRADPVFGSYLTLPFVDITLVFSHVIVAGFFAWVVAGWLRRALLAPPEATADAASLPFALGAMDVLFAFGALNILFAAFVLVQVGWLFGGEAVVLRTTGLSYAAYARRGFFELTWVSSLLLAVLLGARALIPDADSRAPRFYRRLGFPLVTLLGAVMFSAGARMKLYVEYYGVSSDRLYATAFMIWLAIVFVWFALTVLRSRPRTFAAGLVVSGFVVLFALNCINPDGLVARSNLARGAVTRDGTSRVDLRYVASLGGDAVPSLVSALMAPSAVIDTAAQGDRCAAIKILLDRWTGEKHAATDRDWTQWNLSRSHAFSAVRTHEAELRQLACVKAPAEPTTPPAT